MIITQIYDNVRTDNSQSSIVIDFLTAQALGKPNGLTKYPLIDVMDNGQCLDALLSKHGHNLRPLVTIQTTHRLIENQQRKPRKSMEGQRQGDRYSVTLASRKTSEILIVLGSQTQVECYLVGRCLIAPAICALSVS